MCLVAPVLLGLYVLVVIWVAAGGPTWWYVLGTAVAVLVAAGSLLPGLYLRRLHRSGTIALDSAGMWQIQHDRAELLPWEWIQAVSARRSAESQAMRRRLRHRAAGTFADVIRNRDARSSRQLYLTPDTLEVYLTEEGATALLGHGTWLRPIHHDEKPPRSDLPWERIRYPFTVWDHCQAAIDYVVAHRPQVWVNERLP